MSGPLILAVPSKGRLLENTNAFLARAGLGVRRDRGARDYRGMLEGVEGVEVWSLSAGEIARELSTGGVHLGITGEDLLRETIARPEDAVELVSPLGFGDANVVVAVPQMWFDVKMMTDLDDVAQSFRARHGRRLRVATKYVHLTRSFFASHAIGDYLIVESLGATEGAPASGAADLIVDITTTGATLSANALKVLEDGVILKSEANLVAALRAPWSEGRRVALRGLLDRIWAEERARTIREVRALIAGPRESVLADAMTRFGCAAPERDAGSGTVVLHCAADQVHAVADYLRSRGAETVSVYRPEYVFQAVNPLFERVNARLSQ